MKTNYGGDRFAPRHSRDRNKYKPPTLELTEAELLSQDKGKNWRYSYPQHIPNFQHKSHRRHWGCVNNICSLPATCKRPVGQSPLAEDSDAIVTILQSQLKDEKAKQAHLDSVRRNLERRLQVAKASGNDRLIDLLKQEWQQLEMSI